MARRRREDRRNWNCPRCGGEYRKAKSGAVNCNGCGHVPEDRMQDGFERGADGGYVDGGYRRSPVRED